MFKYKYMKKFMRFLLKIVINEENEEQNNTLDLILEVFCRYAVKLGWMKYNRENNVYELTKKGERFAFKE